MKLKKIFYCYFAVLLVFTLYSYTQINPEVFKLINKPFSQVLQSFFFFGRKRRKLSSLAFSFIVTLLFLFYFKFLNEIGKIEIRQLWKLILVTVFLLLLAYPAAFSHDPFKYIFDARVLVKYKKNPYFFAPENMPEDFLAQNKLTHWSGSSFEYGPIWLFLTSGLIFLVKDNLLLSLLFLKALGVFSYLASIFVLHKLSQKKFNDNSAVVFFAFNPLILVDSLVTPHIDITMFFFLIISVYFFVNRKIGWSFFYWFLSVGTKFVSILIIPLLILFKKREKQLNFKTKLILCLLSVYFLIFFEVVFRTINSWYFIMPIGLISLFNKNFYLRQLVFANSIGALIRYLPFIYMGFFDPHNKIRLILFILVHILFIVYVVIKVPFLKIIKGFYYCPGKR